MFRHNLHWSISLILALSLFSCENTDNVDLSGSPIIDSSTLNEELIFIENDFFDSLSLIIDTNVLEVISLPRPNSGTYSFAEAEKTRIDIYNLNPSFQYHAWKNPTTGGAVHINANDELIVYQTTYHFMYDTISNIHCPDSIDLRSYVGGMGYGNPASVLITSEINPKRSMAITKILDDLFTPGIQLYYLKTKAIPSPLWFSNH